MTPYRPRLTPERLARALAKVPLYGWETGGVFQADYAKRAARLLEELRK